jgi:hypothetical protein
MFEEDTVPKPEFAARAWSVERAIESVPTTQLGV